MSQDTIAFKVWFQYEEQGMEGFSKTFEAKDADHAQDLARDFAFTKREAGQGAFLPVYVESVYRG